MRRFRRMFAAYEIAFVFAAFRRIYKCGEMRHCSFRRISPHFRRILPHLAVFSPHNAAIWRTGTTHHKC
jgi:hypothetical protein